VLSQNKPLMAAMLIKTNEITQRFSIFIINPIILGVKINKINKKTKNTLLKIYLLILKSNNYIDLPRYVFINTKFGFKKFKVEYEIVVLNF
jgi:hypothetical protein